MRWCLHQYSKLSRVKKSFLYFFLPFSHVFHKAWVVQNLFVNFGDIIGWTNVSGRRFSKKRIVLGVKHIKRELIRGMIFFLTYQSKNHSNTVFLEGLHVWVAKAYKFFIWAQASKQLLKKFHFVVKSLMYFLSEKKVLIHRYLNTYALSSVDLKLKVNFDILHPLPSLKTFSL